MRKKARTGDFGAEGEGAGLRVRRLRQVLLDASDVPCTNNSQRLSRFDNVELTGHQVVLVVIESRRILRWVKALLGRSERAVDEAGAPVESLITDDLLGAEREGC